MIKEQLNKLGINPSDHFIEQATKVMNRYNNSGFNITEETFCKFIASNWDKNFPDQDKVEADVKRKIHYANLSTIKKTIKPPGRNEPCPCGSGKKFKKCCLK